MSTRWVAGFIRLCAWMLVLLGASRALAQPMFDPAQMSGIPRPDPQVPAGEIIVRVIRGQMTNNVAGQEVELVSSSGESRKEKTGADGRARFAGLSTGSRWTARTELDGQALVSQPLDVTGQAGIRLMLVAKAAAPAAGGAGGTPAVAGTGGTPAAAGAGGTPAGAAPSAPAAAGDRSKLRLGETTRLIVEFEDDWLSFFWVYDLRNDGTEPYQPGPEGLVLPLPMGAKSASIQRMGSEAPPAKVIEGLGTVWNGPIPPGATQLIVGFALPFEGEARLRTQVGLPLAEWQLITRDSSGLSFEGDGVGQPERRARDGQAFTVLLGRAVGPAGIDVVIRGKHHDKRARWAGLVVACVLFLWAAGGAISGRQSAEASKGTLEQEIEAAYDALVALEARASKDRSGKLAAERAVLVEKLETLYRKSEG